MEALEALPLPHALGRHRRPLPDDSQRVRRPPPLKGDTDNRRAERQLPPSPLVSPAAAPAAASAAAATAMAGSAAAATAMAGSDEGELLLGLNEGVMSMTSVLRALKREESSLYNCAASIAGDARFVAQVPPPFPAVQWGDCTAECKVWRACAVDVSVPSCASAFHRSSACKPAAGVCASPTGFHPLLSAGRGNVPVSASLCKPALRPVVPSRGCGHRQPLCGRPSRCRQRS